MPRIFTITKSSLDRKLAVYNTVQKTATIDLFSASDTLAISTMLCRLRFKFGISGPAPNWISSYMAHHQQSVPVGQKQSSTFDCKYGVPQRSVLRPMLFTLYVAPLVKIILPKTEYSNRLTVNDNVFLSALAILHKLL